MALTAAADFTLLCMHFILLQRSSLTMVQTTAAASSFLCMHSLLLHRSLQVRLVQPVVLF